MAILGMEKRTVDIHKPSPMSNESLRRGQKVVQTHTQADLLDHLVGVLGVDVILDGEGSVFLKVFGHDLHKVGDFSLWYVLVRVWEGG